MWKEHLEEIRQEEKRYGEDINCGISEEEAGAFIKAVKEELGIALPEEYLKILRTINGIEFNGFILYGVDEPLLKETPNQHINGMIDCNKVWYENEWQKQYFLSELPVMHISTMHFYILAIVPISTYNCSVAVFSAYKCAI